MSHNGSPALGRSVLRGRADIAVLGLEHGRFDFADVRKARVQASRRFTCEMTVRAGKVLWDRGRRAGTPAPGRRP